MKDSGIRPVALTQALKYFATIAATNLAAGKIEVPRA
jgi:hypothetical protein